MEKYKDSGGNIKKLFRRSDLFKMDKDLYDVTQQELKDEMKRDGGYTVAGLKTSGSGMKFLESKYELNKVELR